MKHLLLTSSALMLMLWATAMTAIADNSLTSLIDTDFNGKADTLTTAFISQFLNQSKGTFWAVPKDQSNRDAETTYIYWQQAHAMDALIYSYERIKSSSPTKANAYERYMKAWYNNHANNWYHDNNDPTGFLNEFTDDMCWISLTLLHLSEALGDDRYADMAKQVFDDYIEPRGWADEKGFWGLPWKSTDNGRNACTNAPGCLVSSKLYLKYGDEKYMETAIKICTYQLNEMKTKLNNDGRVENPPLTYTQGTFAEACRQLYHITGESAYLQTAIKVTTYMLTNGSCTYQGILRDEGPSMDQSIFKAVAIPYAVNMVLDEKVPLSSRKTFLRYLQTNAKTLWNNLDLSNYPKVYCNYYWGEPVDPTAVPSMGAMTSGVSLMENVARMTIKLKEAEEAAGVPEVKDKESNGVSKMYSMDGRRVAEGTSFHDSLRKGIYVSNGKKVIVK
jgi:predicted alpha-1,6-mannanase (GH76 family)